tara:strand:+ start:169 stop:726 length:558 start_codon:yes stop_codon:yes gene_type:complete
MKFFNLNKIITFLSSLIILIVLCINNQKQSTKLKILIWNTPVLSLGTYIAISTGAGYILSFIATSALSKSNTSSSKKTIKYKSERQEEDNFINQEQNKNTEYDSILIERDINEPSPTVKANFRIISNNNIQRKSQQINNKQNINHNSFFSDETNNQPYQQENNTIDNNDIRQLSNDWEDYTYLNW